MFQGDSSSSNDSDDSDNYSDNNSEIQQINRNRIRDQRQMTQQQQVNNYYSQLFIIIFIVPCYYTRICVFSILIAIIALISGIHTSFCYTNLNIIFVINSNIKNKCGTILNL